LASVLLASAIVRPPLAFVGAGVEFFIAIFVFDNNLYCAIYLQEKLIIHAKNLKKLLN